MTITFLPCCRGNGSHKIWYSYIGLWRQVESIFAHGHACGNGHFVADAAVFSGYSSRIFFKNNTSHQHQSVYTTTPSRRYITCALSKRLSR